MDFAVLNSDEPWTESIKVLGARNVHEKIWRLVCPRGKKTGLLVLVPKSRVDGGLCRSTPVDATIVASPSDSEFSKEL